HYFSNDTASTQIYTLSLHDALPIYINPSEQSLPRKTRRILAQLRADKSPILKAYLHEIDSKSCPSAACPLCNYHLHNTQHLFSRSEEHTSELQSRSDLVCRLLLEKK